MQTLNKFNYLASTPDMGAIMKANALSTISDLDCVKIGIVQEFYPDDLTVQVQVAWKKTLGTNADGTQNVKDYAPIYAKVCYCNPFITFPIEKGMECLLLFSDREIESWFINGDINPEGYTRMHDLTDCIAIFGIRSLPKMIQILTDCLHLFYGNSSVELAENQINVTTPLVNVTGNTLQDGDITATTLNATTAATGTFKSSDSKTITVVNGIVTSIA